MQGAWPSKLGFELVAFEAFRAGDQDFSPQITRSAALKPDAIYVAGATGDGIKVVSQIREAGIEKRRSPATARSRIRSTGTAPRASVKGDYTWLGQDLSSPTAQLKKFLDSYNKRFTQQEATRFSTYGYDSVMAP